VNTAPIGRLGPAADPPFARRPVAFVILLTLATFVAYVAAGALTRQLGLDPRLFIVLADVPLLLVGAAVLARRGGLRGAGIRPQPWGRAFGLTALLFLPAVVTLALALRFGGSWAPAEILTFALLALLVGLTEEVLFRGLAYSALRRLGVTRAALGSALIFGLLHLLNVAQGAGFVVTVLQVVYAFALGSAFAAGLEAGGRLTPLVAAHAATDLFAYIAGGGTVNGSGHEGLIAVITAGSIVVFGVYTVWLLRSAAAAPYARPLRR